jgi:alpha-amylase/alpha-mannosidase (GH57 family)
LLCQTKTSILFLESSKVFCYRSNCLDKVFFAFGIHNHQPVGNFDFIFEDAYRKAYFPFPKALAKHPKIRIAPHYSGILLEWLSNHHPEFIKRLSALVASGQVEMITGGYYEPILMTIPDRDKLGQITKLTHSIHNITGFRQKDCGWQNGSGSRICQKF